MSQTTIPSSPPSPAFSIRDPASCRIFGERPFRADGEVLALAFAADGSLWSVEEGGSLRHWDVTTGRQRDWHALGEAATLWNFRGDARIVASAGDDLVLWNVLAGRMVTSIPHSSWISALAFGTQLDVVATGSDDGVIRIWDTGDGQMLQQLKGHQHPVSALAFSPDGKRLASAGEDRLIFLWNLDSGAIDGVYVGHTDRIPALAWHPSGQRLISAGWDTTARVWDVDTCEPVILLNSHASQVQTLALSPDGALLACADSANAIHLWDMASYETLHILDGHEAEVRGLAFSPDGRRLASGGADRAIHLWDASRGEPWHDRQPSAANGSVRQTIVSLCPDGGRLAATAGATLHVWDVLSGKLVHEQRGEHLLHAVAHSPDGRLLAVSGDAPRISLLDSASFRSHHGDSVALEGPQPPITTLAFSSDGAFLASANPTCGDVWIWNVASGQPALLIPDALDGCTVQALAFQPRSSVLAVGGIDWLATSGSDGCVTLWDVSTRRREVSFRGGTTSVAFHPSGKQLAAASLGRSIRVWDVEARRGVTELTGHTDAVRCVAYSPDGRWLVSGGDDRTLRLWDANTCALLGVCELHTQIKSLAFAPDGSTLFTGNGNDSCCQVDVPGAFVS
jgi:WD40 repeat protein